MTVSLGNGVDIGNLVTAETNPLTGGIEYIDFAGGDYLLPTKRINSIKGAEILDFATSGFLPSGVSFSGGSTYGGLGRLAVQSTGTLTHNPKGWSDGSACLEFTPNADSAEFRMYFDGTTGFKATARYSFGWSDPRAIYGSAGA